MRKYSRANRSAARNPPRRCGWVVFQSQHEKLLAEAIVMTEAQEVESLDRVLTRLALTDEKDLEKVRGLANACM